MRIKWKLVWVLLEIVLILMQDRRTVCAECTIRLENHFGRTHWNSEVMWVIWNLTLVRLEIVLVLGVRFPLNVPQAQKSFWTHPMVLLGGDAQLEARSGPFGDSANLDARYVHSLCQMDHRIGNHFGCTWRYS
jgi:hypothetical protein